MGIKVFTDAASNLFASFLKEKNYDIKVLPMTLDVDGKTYQCYENEINIEEFSKEIYAKMKEGANIKTSLANPDVWAKAYEEEIRNGNKVIVFTLASGISGTYNAACLAAEMVNEDANEEMVHVIDTRTASFGEGMQATYCYDLIKQGLDFESVVKKCEEHVWVVRSEFSVDDINFIARTGRVNKLIAKIANFLNIKVILKGGKDATIQLYKKIYGRVKALKELARICATKIKEKGEKVYIAHCNCEKDALTLKNLLNKEGINDIEIYWYDIITGSHTGPGNIAIFYEGFNRD